MGNSLQFLEVLLEDGFINSKLRLNDTTRPHSDSQDIRLSGNVVRSEDSIQILKETAEKNHVSVTTPVWF